MATHADSHELKLLREAHHQFFITVYTSTDALVNRYVCGGGLDLGLNEAGMEDARKLARRFKKNPLKIKKLIASPELRTIQLADLLHDEMRGKIMLFRELADQFFGSLEGKPFNDQIDLNDPPNGENEESFSLRVHQGLVRVLKEKDLCLIATHPRVAQQIFEWIGLGKESITPGEFYRVDLPAGGGIAHFNTV